MTYLEEWQKLKDAFRAGNEAVAQEVKKIKARLKHAKAVDASDLDAIDSLERALELSVVLTKKKTGFSQVLPAYEKLLDKMEALVAKGVPPSDKKTWEPYVKALRTLKPANEKANAAVRAGFGKWIDQSGRESKKYAKAYRTLGKEMPKLLDGQSKPAKDLLIGLEKIQRRIAEQLQKLWLYLEPGMKTW